MNFLRKYSSQKKSGELSQNLLEGDSDSQISMNTNLTIRKGHRPLTLLPLIAIIFYGVSGGPFGSEPVVQAGGPLLAIFGFLFFPLVWSVPEALVTAELATMFPENSGYVVWVSSAFGEFWGFQEGFWSWFSGVTDNSIYPVLFTKYLEVFLPSLKNKVYRYVITVVLAYFNFRGIQVVGRSAQYMAMIVLAPFLIMTLIAIPRINMSNWFLTNVKSINWTDYFNVLFWNLNYWDSVSTLAGEVKDPSKNFPKAMFGALVLVVLSYLIPILVGLGVVSDTKQWNNGFFAQLAQLIGGNWLGLFIIISSAISQLGQFNAEMSSDAFLLQGMSERGLIPQVFATKSRYGTPTLGILMSLLGVLIITNFKLMQVIEMLNIIYCLAELLEFGAFLWLRFKHPQVARPFKIKASSWGCLVLLLPATVLLVYIILLPFIDYKQDQRSIIIVLVSAILSGFILYPLFQYMKRKKMCQFVEQEENVIEQLETLIEEETPVDDFLTHQTSNDLSNYDIVIDNHKLRMVRNSLQFEENDMSYRTEVGSRSMQVPPVQNNFENKPNLQSKSTDV